MKLKKIGKALLFPHIAVMLVLTPVSIAFLVYAMVVLGTETAEAIASYVLAAYTLTVWCFKIPNIIRFFKRFKAQNKYVTRWSSDPHLRVKVTLYGSVAWNAAYALLQLGLGFWHKTFWFYSLAGYYIALALMRFSLSRHISRHSTGQKTITELKKYRACGIAFLIMNLFLALIIFFMVYWNRTFRHHEITTITLAAYTFTSFTLAVVNSVRYRKYNSPVYSASKAISMASACVSMLTLEATMLTTFGKETLTLTARRIFLGTSGGVISAFIIAMAVYMIINGTKQIKKLNHNGAINGQ